MSTEGTSSRGDDERQGDVQGSGSTSKPDVAPSRRGSRASGPDVSGSSGSSSGPPSGSSSDRPSDPSSGPPSGQASSGESSTSAASVRPPVPVTQQIGRVVVFLLAVLFGVFAVANSQSVDFSWIFGGTEVQTAPDGSRVGGGVPLIVLMLGSALVGAGLTWFATWQAGRARRRAGATHPKH